MALSTYRRTLHSKDGIVTQELVVACPQRIDVVPIRECASCELCEGLQLDAGVGVRCAVEPPEAVVGAPGAQAPITTIMTTPVVSVMADASIENVQWLLADRGIGAVPVLDAAGRPIGIVAKTDLLRDRDEPTITAAEHERESSRESDLSERETSGLRACDVMTPVVHALLERMSIAAAAALMARERIHHVLVVNDTSTLVGIVSALDIARWVAARERFTPSKA